MSLIPGSTRHNMKTRVSLAWFEIKRKRVEWWFVLKRDARCRPLICGPFLGNSWHVYTFKDLVERSQKFTAMNHCLKVGLLSRPSPILLYGACYSFIFILSLRQAVVLWEVIRERWDWGGCFFFFSSQMNFHGFSSALWLDHGQEVSASMGTLIALV